MRRQAKNKRDATGIADAQKVGEREVKEDYNRKALNWKIMSGKNTLFVPE